MNRDALFAGIAAQREFDVAIIGGGATGAGIAWDAASRGLSTLLVERGDFGQGTSSKSTKLIHGGVRYLAQGQLGLVRESLQERRLLLANATAHVRPLRFMVPFEGWFDRLKYHTGLTVYDLLASSPQPSRRLSREEFRAHTPNLQPRFTGGMAYSDAQFDDSRLLLSVLTRAVAHRAVVVNYAEVVGFGKRRDGRLGSLVIHDHETAKTCEIEARIVINATGPSTAATARLDDGAGAPEITLSRGSHVVVSREFWPCESALLMPRTPDGRVMFAIPWHDHVLLGTTDVLIDGTAGASLPVCASANEVDFILEMASRYFEHAPKINDVRACFAGVRPLAGGTTTATARVSREYQLTTSPAGLISITGGKWTTFRRMAAACVDYALAQHPLQASCSTTATELLPSRIELHSNNLMQQPQESASLPETTPLVDGLSYHQGDAVRAIRFEMARHVEDILARRTRCLFLNAAAASAAAPKVAALLASELGHDATWIATELVAFQRCAASYQLPDRHPGDRALIP
ncbi:MAG: glycerol-3-phosphate dehydrogenase/oxidase [Gammaproteobacteria bacterium]|nr:glycerol-3-phosphate dehydrogenase/oxidase [Gammaproteobacteria bacterium]